MTETDSPLLQLGALAGDDIFVEYISTGTTRCVFL